MYLFLAKATRYPKQYKSMSHVEAPYSYELSPPRKAQLVPSEWHIKLISTESSHSHFTLPLNRRNPSFQHPVCYLASSNLLLRYANYQVVNIKQQNLCGTNLFIAFIFIICNLFISFKVGLIPIKFNKK